MPITVFLDIDLGDKAAYDQQLEQFETTKQFFKSVKSQYGLTGSLEGQSDDSLELLSEAFGADPTWASKAQFTGRPPSPIRAGRVLVELHDKEVPKAADNFKCLCTGEKGTGKASGKPLHYKGNKFHRIVEGFVCQGGDIVRGDGSGGDSIYGGKFNDEKPGLKLKHDAMGVVGMANSGKNSNTSQFYFTLAAAPQCDGKQVVVGRVVKGMEVLQRIGAEAASSDGTPRVDVTIAECGVVGQV